MRILISTFGGDDPDKVIHAMRTLPYDQLVVIGNSSIDDSQGLEAIKRLERMVDREVKIEHVEEPGFLEQVNAICEVMVKHRYDPTSGSRDTIILNISGGSKLLGDAALFAAFRIGIETYHCDSRVTKLPVLRGATAVDMFTPLQTEFILCVGNRNLALNDLVAKLRSKNRQSAERILRELRRAGVVHTELKEGRILVSLTDSGSEIERMLVLANGNRPSRRPSKMTS